MNYVADAPRRNGRRARFRDSVHCIDWIVCREQSTATGLARDRRRGRVGIAFRSAGGLGAVASLAAVDVSDQNTPVAIYRHIKEVEQVATDIRAAFGPDATTLHGCVRRCVGSGPGLTAIEGVGDIEMPFAIEAGLQRVSRRSCSIECHGSTTSIAGDRGWVPDILKAIRGADVAKVLPRLTVIVRSHNSRSAVFVSNDVVNAIGFIDRDRGILEAHRRSR